jgi:hypothetical protein
MSTASSTAVQPGYLMLSLGAPRRLAILRARAATSNKPDWRAAREWTLVNWRGAFGDLAQGRQGPPCGGEAIWFTHTGAALRAERDADDVADLGHRGWYTDALQHDVARGIVGRLPHGRFAAGYRWTCNGERVYFDRVHADKREAARTADEHARVFAELACEDDERFQAMVRAEDAAADAQRQLLKMWPARHVSEALRGDVRELIGALRRCRDVLHEATQAYERG